MGNIKAILRPNYFDKNGLAPILIYVSVKRQKVYFKTGLKADRNNWDQMNEKLTGPGKQKDNNLIIDVCKGRVAEIFKKYRLRNQENDLTADILRKEYRVPSRSIDFHTFLSDTINGRGDIGSNSRKHHKSVANKLKIFRQKLSFAEFTPKFIDEFRYYLKHTLNNKTNTIHFNLKMLKTYTNIAIRDKIIDMDPFAKIINRQVKPEMIFLMPDELNKLTVLFKEKKLPEKLQLILRAFLFSCFTGLRISDLKRITRLNIIGDFLVITPYKTREIKNDPIRIPLNIAALDLINENKSNIGPLFYFYAEQTANKKIKDIANRDDMKINPKISFKSGRHTFATMFLREGGRVEVLQKILGHSKITDTMKYGHVLMEDIVKEMKVMNKLW